MPTMVSVCHLGVSVPPVSPSGEEWDKRTELTWDQSWHSSCRDLQRLETLKNLHGPSLGKGCLLVSWCRPQGSSCWSSLTQLSHQQQPTVGWCGGYPEKVPLHQIWWKSEHLFECYIMVWQMDEQDSKIVDDPCYSGLVTENTVFLSLCSLPWQLVCPSLCRCHSLNVLFSSNRKIRRAVWLNELRLIIITGTVTCCTVYFVC